MDYPPQLDLRIKYTHLLASVVLTLVVTGSFWLLHKHREKQLADAWLIEVSGKQRMYTEKIVKDALLLAYARDSVFFGRRLRQLRNDVSDWQSADRQLLSPAARQGTSIGNSPQVQALLRRQRVSRFAMVQAAEALTFADTVAGAGRRAAYLRSHIARLLYYSPAVLAGREAITGQFRREAEAKLDEASRLGGYVAFVLLAVIGLQHVLVYRPQRKLVRRFVNQLQQKLDKLEEAEKELSAANASLIRVNAFQTAILRNAVVAIISTDGQGRITSTNETARAWLGYHEVELREQSVLRLLGNGETPGGPEAMLGELVVGVEPGRPVTREWALRKKDGATLPVQLSISVIAGEGDRAAGFLFVGTDLTEPYQIRQTLHGVLDCSLSGIMAFRSVREAGGAIADFAWTVVNARAETMVSRSADFLVGRKLLEEMPGNREEGLFDRYVRVVETGEPMEHEHYYDHEGIRTWFHTVAVKLNDGFVVTFADVSRWRNAEGKLQQMYNDLLATEEELRCRGEEMAAMNDTLEHTIGELKAAQSHLVQSEKMAAIGQLTAGIAHEINNPVNYIAVGIHNLQGAAGEIFQLLDAYDRLAGPGTAQTCGALTQMQGLKEQLYYLDNRRVIRETIDSIVIGVGRTAEIIKGLRNFSRLDEALLKNADIHEGIDSTLVLLSFQTKDRITVVKDYSPGLESIECYPGLLNQVLMNILTNAIQAMESAGTLSISTRDLDDQVSISISDTGPGIPNEYIPKLFDPFFTTKPVGQGTGLGLSISYSIVKKHQGDISVRSEAGTGATFVITLPKKLSESLAEAAPA